MRNLILVLFVLLALTVATAYLTRDTTQTDSRHNNSSDKMQDMPIKPKAVLNFNPESLTLAYGQTTTASLQIVYQGNKPDFAQFELGYNPEVISEISVFPGSFFESPAILLDSIDELNGRVSYAIKSINNQGATENSSVLININFRITGRNADSTTIYFLPKTKMSTENESVELEIPDSLNIYIKNGATPIVTSPAI